MSRSRWWQSRRGERVVLVGLIVLVLAVGALGAGFILRGPGEAVDGAGQKALVPLTAPTPPATLPREGTLVDARIQADGRVEVTQWIRRREVLGEIVLRAPDAPQIGATPEATDLVIRTSYGEVPILDTTVGPRSRTIDLIRSSALVRLTYTLGGVAEKSATPPGRALIGAVALDVGDATGTTRVQVGGRRILSLACAAGGSDGEDLRSCGGAGGQGWVVRLTGQQAQDRVVASVDLAVGTPNGGTGS